MKNSPAVFLFVRTKLCMPYLKASKKNPHVLNLSPPLNMNPIWFKSHVAYTMAKYGMSMCVLGMAEEFKNDRIAFNALWPKTGTTTDSYCCSTFPFFFSSQISRGVYSIS